MDLCQKKSRNFRPDEKAAGKGDYWIWTAIALPSRLRVTSYLLARSAVKKPPRPSSNSSKPVPMVELPSLPVTNFRPTSPRWRPTTASPSRCPLSGVLAGGVIEAQRGVVSAQADDKIVIIEAHGFGPQINTAYVERNNLTLR